jgi:competence protein ComEC
MLVDCGCKKNEDVVSGEIENIFDYYLGTTGNTLRSLIMTHPDGDHCNLIQKLIINKKVKIDYFMYGGAQGQYAKKLDFKTVKKQVTKTYKFADKYFSPSVDTDLSFDGKGKLPNVDVRILAANVGIKPNDTSVVLMLTCGKINIFLMGDAEKMTEDFLMKKIDKNTALKSIIAKGTTVLKAGHHGSNTSSTQNWIDYIKPEDVFISSDTKTFGPKSVSLPRSEIISRFTPFDNKDKNKLHNYVQYNGTSEEHEMKLTTAWLFTTLHLLEFSGMKDKDGKALFTSYGTSWYYETDGSAEYVWPACGWSAVNKAY